jgi:hypothetical protein
MYVIQYLDELGNPRLTCTSDLGEAHALCDKWHDGGSASKVYLVRETDDALAARSAVEMGAGEVIYTPTEPASETEILKAAAAFPNEFGF